MMGMLSLAQDVAPEEKGCSRTKMAVMASVSAISWSTKSPDQNLAVSAPDASAGG